MHECTLALKKTHSRGRKMNKSLPIARRNVGRANRRYLRDLRLLISCNDRIFIVKALSDIYNLKPGFFDRVE